MGSPEPRTVHGVVTQGRGSPEAHYAHYVTEFDVQVTTDADAAT